MFSNRISRFYSDWAFDEEAEGAAPEAPAGFVAVPRAQLPLAAQQSLEQHQRLYQMAFAKALAARTSTPDAGL